MQVIRIFGDLSYGSGNNTALRGLIQSLETLGYTPEMLRVIGVEPGYFNCGFGSDKWFESYIFQDWPHEREDISIVLSDTEKMGRFDFSMHYGIAYCSSIEPCQVNNLNKFSEIWVPSSHLKADFQKRGVIKPIHVIRHALLRGLLAHGVDRARSGLNKLRLYTIGQWDESLLKAYFATGWNVTSPVHLACHCPPVARSDGGMQAESWKTQEAAKALYHAEPKPGELPGFSLSTKALSYEDLYNLHLSRDMYVTTNFSMSVVEALACGNPVIAVDGPGFENLTELLRTIDQDLDDVVWLFEAKSTLADALVLNGNHRSVPRSVASLVREYYSPSAVGALIAERLKEINV